MDQPIEVSIFLPVSPAELFAAWLSSEQHSAFTGSLANIMPEVGGEFTAWDGYISGKTLAIEFPKRILQAWRTSEFPQQSPDSLLEVLIEPAGEGSNLAFRHSNIPDGQSQNYLAGWLEYYFEPMKVYFCGSDE